MLDKIRNELEAQQMDYVPFGYPLKYDPIEGTWTILDIPGYTFSRDGINYLLYRLEHYLDKKKARELLSTSYKEFTEYINAARFEQAIHENWRQEQELLAAVLSKTIYGIMTKYKPVPNVHILSLIEDHKLEDRISCYDLSIKEFNVYLGDRNQDSFEWGLCIRNGETGHVTLGYHCYIKRDDYVFTFPYDHVRRHMSPVNQVTNDLTAVLESIHEIQFWDMVQATKARDYAVQLSEKHEKLQPMLDKYLKNDYNLHKLVVELLNLRNQRGYKTVCSKAVDWCLGRVANDLDNQSSKNG